MPPENPESRRQYRVDVRLDMENWWWSCMRPFRTYVEADAYATEIYARWSLITQTRVSRVTGDDVTTMKTEGPYDPRNESER